MYILNGLDEGEKDETFSPPFPRDSHFVNDGLILGWSLDQTQLLSIESSKKSWVRWKSQSTIFVEDKVL
jgi:hypothetical protein